MHSLLICQGESLKLSVKRGFSKDNLAGQMIERR